VIVEMEVPRTVGVRTADLFRIEKQESIGAKLRSGQVELDAEIHFNK
jgi:hypothetical protein